MAVGKNKRLTKSGKKGSKKKAVDPFLTKEWYDLRAPKMFTKSQCGKTLCSKTRGTKVSSDVLIGRTVEVNMADLQKDDDQGYRKITLMVEDVQGRNCYTNFHGMSLTRDKLCSLIKKWQSTIEGVADAKTTDGYTVRLFCIGLGGKQQNQVKTTAYAQTAKIRQIRKIMVTRMQAAASASTLKELVSNLIPEVISREIQKHCTSVYPLKDCFIRKVKVLKKPKFDITKLMEIHEKTDMHDHAAMERPEETEAVNTLTAAVEADAAEA